MDNKTLLVGGAAILAVAVVWTQTRDTKPKTDPRVAELEAQVADLTDKLGEMRDSVAGMAERADAQADAIAQSAALGSRLAKTVQGLGSISASGGSEQASSGEAAPAAAGGSEQAASESAPGGLGAGETAILAEGAIRAFVSRVDDAAQTVRVLVNGSMETLGSDAPVKVSVDGQDCEVSLDGIDRGTVQLSAKCSAASGASGGDAGAEADAAAAAPSETTEEGIAPGNVASFADGAVRVFVSWIAEDGSAARIAVNGTDQTVLAVGDSTEVDGCNLSLTGISDGRASLGYGCSS